MKNDTKKTSDQPSGIRTPPIGDARINSKFVSKRADPKPGKRRASTKS